jgi:hypothetical protein
MRRKPGAFPSDNSHAARVAWWASFLATIAIVALLGLARSAQAATVADPLLSALAFPTTTDAEEEDEEAEAAEEDGEELGECEAADEEDECDEASELETGEECILKSTEATVLVLPGQDKVKLTLHYTAFSPAVVSVRYGLRGGKGRLKMGGDSRRFGHRGVFRETEKLSEAEMAKTKAATEFDVDAHAINTPGWCRGLFDRELNRRHVSSARVLWTD